MHSHTNRTVFLPGQGHQSTPFWPSARGLSILVVILLSLCHAEIPGLTLFQRLFEQTGCSDPWIPSLNNSPSPPIQLTERFPLVSFLFECMSIRWREKCAEALSWFSSLTYLLWQYQQANCSLALERKTIHVITTVHSAVPKSKVWNNCRIFSSEKYLLPGKVAWA